MRRALFAAFLLALPVLAALAPPARAALSERDRADIARVEAYLNGIQTLQGRFLQVAPDGGVSEGQVYLRRPGRLRFEYAPPSPILVVADGLFVVFHDKELGQTDRIPLGATPIGVLVRETIKLSGDVGVRAVSRAPGVLRVSLFDPARPEEGQITLVFGEQPLELRQWQVTDARGQVTSITLSGVELNQPLPGKLFVVTDPAPGEARPR
jgi:outer membrane lipoprotein-sorting protein